MLREPHFSTDNDVSIARMYQYFYGINLFSRLGKFACKSGTLCAAGLESTTAAGHFCEDWLF